MKLVFQYMVIFLNFLTTSSPLHPLQVENCGSNSRLVVDDYGKVRIERDEWRTRRPSPKANQIGMNKNGGLSTRLRAGSPFAEGVLCAFLGPLSFY